MQGYFYRELVYDTHYFRVEGYLQFSGAEELGRFRSKK